MTVEDLYLLAGHEPYLDQRLPVPVNATIVPVGSLLHPHVIQPDGGMIYRCLTEFPNRRAGEIVPLSTITFELAGGDLWPAVGDYQAVVEDLVALSRAGGCDAVPIGLPEMTLILLINGPLTINTVYRTDGSAEQVGPDEREAALDDLSGKINVLAQEDPLWPGDHLLPPPRDAPLPYRPRRTLG